MYDRAFTNHVNALNVKLINLSYINLVLHLIYTMYMLKYGFLII